jgi:hypothetical protein
MLFAKYCRCKDCELARRVDKPADKVETVRVERINEGRFVDRNNIDVRASRFDHALKQRRTIGAFAFGKDYLSLKTICNRYAQFLILPSILCNEKCIFLLILLDYLD